MGLNGNDYTQQVNSDQGIRTQYGIILPPGARVAAYVRSTGLQSGDDTFLAQNLVATVAAGMARVRAGFGDFIVCLPNHSELISDATTLTNATVAGARVIGVGTGGNAPVLSWNGVGSKWTISVNDVVVSGVRLLLAGTPGALASNTAQAINITGNGVVFSYNDIETANANASCVNPFLISGTASRCEIAANIVRGNLINGSTAIAFVLSGTGSDNRIADNEMVVSCSTTLGIIQVSGANTGLKILRNYLVNTNQTASTACINLANVAIGGICADNRISVTSTGAMVSGTTGITIGAAVLMAFDNNLTTNDFLRSGIIMPQADT
jgi:hypothetical protein